MAYICVIWTTCCEYYFLIAIKMNALVTYVSHCHPLGGKCVLQAEIQTILVSFNLKLTLETMSVSLFSFITFFPLLYRSTVILSVLTLE